MLLIMISVQASTLPTQATLMLPQLTASTTMSEETAYQLTHNLTLTESKQLPQGASLYILPGACLTLKRATLTCAKGASIYAMGGRIVLENGTLNMHNNCHLGIEGKGIEGVGTIMGQETTLSAPIKPIFGKDVKITGKWKIDRAFPQWFASDNTPNWAQAINRAIAMKGSGEVFLPRGIYTMSTTIHVPFGIKLTGEAGRPEQDKRLNHDCTIIKPSQGETHFDGGYMMTVNVKHGAGETITQEQAQWETAFPIAGTEVSNLYFLNEGRRHKAMLVAGGMKIDQNTFNSCLQAVAFINGNYSDMRRVTNNTVYVPGNVNTGSKREPLYAFDIKGLGDALIFEGNAVHDSDNYTRALRVTSSMGGSINANILNGDILIKNCKGIVYSGNHSEVGAQLTIKESSVTMHSNFFEKGTRPSIVIEGGENGGVSTVAMNSSQFIFIDQLRYANETAQQNLERINGISEVDIAIDKFTNLNLNNSYRNDIPSANNIGSQYLFGVNIAQLNKSQLKSNNQLNRMSHTLSTHGAIGKNLRPSSPIVSMPRDSRISLYGKNGNVKWLGENGSYAYCYEIIGDDGRVSKQGQNITDYKTNHANQHMDFNGDGLLFNVTRDETISPYTPLYARIYRQGPDGLKSIDLPIASSRYFYDNGISIAGYKWR